MCVAKFDSCHCGADFEYLKAFKSHGAARLYCKKQYALLHHPAYDSDDEAPADGPAMRILSGEFKCTGFTSSYKEEGKREMIKIKPTDKLDFLLSSDNVKGSVLVIVPGKERQIDVIPLAW